MTTASALSEHLERNGIRQIGPFRLEREIGKGGFAPVFVAHEIYSGVEMRTVAVKVFSIGGVTSATADLGVSHSSATARARERIVEEARALCRVEHPNVVRFYQIACDPTETIFALAMEHVTGTSLAERLRRDGKLTVRETIDIGVAVGSALAAVHRAGLVHRDLKPANIVEHNGVVKLIDFGIASFERPGREKKALVRVIDDLPFGDGEAEVTSYTVGGDTGLQIAGTLGYMDPVCVSEQVPATGASDLYALGATLFECLTGALPARAAATFRGLGGLRGDVIDGRAPPPTLRSVDPELPEGLAHLVDTLLHASRSGRPQSPDRVVAELERFRRAELGRSRPLPSEEEGPFRGLARFEERHRDLYFGRSGELAASLEVLRTRGLLALMGASGSGKSSLARAALLPAIEDGELGRWPPKWTTITMAPGRDPRAALFSALSSITSATDPDALVDALADHAERTNTGTAVFIDQLEELVTQSDPASRDFVAAFLARVADRTAPGVRAVVAARRDLLDSLLDLPDLSRVLPRATVVVSPMSAATWNEVIDQALEMYGYKLDLSLEEEIAPLAASMPLVQFALHALWEHRDSRRKVIPASALTTLGGFAGALDRHAESTVRGLGADDTVRKIVLALTTARGTRATLPIATVDGLAKDAQRVREALEEARLLERDPSGVTLAHEALTTQWQRLRGWLAEVAEDRALAEEIEAAAILWAEKRAEERLYRRGQLVEAERVRDRASVELSPRAREFIDAGRRVERRVKITLSTAFVVIMGAAVFGAVTYVQDMRARAKETVGALEIVGRTQEDTDKFKKHVQTAAEGEVGKLIAQKDKALKELDEVILAKKKVEADLKATEAEKKATETKLREATDARAKLALELEALKKSTKP